MDKRIMDEIFFESKQIDNNNDLTSEIEIDIILHFLSKVEESMVLYETKINVNKSSKAFNEKDIINEIQKILNKADPSIKLIKGKIREIYLSYSL
ncbi:MAG: hypothetical protein KGD63_08130 [Candidatus Lokiarchaeota archaeon]|nr:hypothetical protein [Candidatus Lokiarchaeota archaeon]